MASRSTILCGFALSHLLGALPMAGLDHGPAHPEEAEDPAVVARNSRIGLGLFAVYFAAYAGYVGLAAFRRETLEAPSPVGGSFAVDYGFGLILGAMAIAMLYGWLCRPAAPAKEAKA